MIDIQEELFASLITRAKKENNEHQLVSITERVSDHEMTRFFEAAKQLNEDRFFWMNAKKDFAFAGVGKAYESVSDEDSFSFTKNAWQKVVRQAIIHNLYEKKGTGIVNVGGFAFDPLKEKTNLWADFANSHFIIPTFLLTKSEDECFLTTTVNVEESTNEAELLERLKHQKQVLFSVNHAFDKQGEILEKEEVAVAKWLEAVKEAREEIRSDKVKKIVMAREMRIRLSKEAEIAPLINRLIETQSDCYVFAYELNESCFVGATPERLVEISGKQLLSTCLAGTSPRGKDAEEDNEIRDALFNDPKNRSEHAYVVEMIRKNIVDYCTSLNIADEPTVLQLKNLQHLYTPVTAQLKETTSVIDIVERLHPTPALGGEPSEAALRFIRDREKLDRGWYGAPLGWMDSNENSEFIVAIRSGLFQGKEASLFAGVGIMKDSDMDLEYEETNVKFSPMLQAMGEEG